MCWMCDLDKSVARESWSTTLATNFAGDDLALVSAHYQKARTDGFLGGGDGVGDKLDITYGLVELPVPILDTVADDTSTEHRITVGGDRFISTINTPGDQDFYAIQLQAGVTYELAVYGTKQGFSGVALPDAYVEIYDAGGNLLAGTDGGSPNDSLGLDARLTFTAPKTGAYYVNARAFDEDGTNGDDGDLVGDYEVFAQVSSYRPYYDVSYESQDDPDTERDERGLPTVNSSPLHSLDWGTAFDGSSRNPDGKEGPRPTGNAVDLEPGGKNVLYYYFARENELFVDNAANPLNLTTTMVAKGFSQWEKDAIELGLERYENVADLIYIETDDRFAADIVFVTYNGTPGRGTPSLAGRMSPPDTASEGQTEYNAGDYRWTPEGLAPGGVFFGTLIHELGHGHGMAHPHDNGGRSSIMRGVEEIETFVYTNGDFDLNQGVYTMMSYQDGWEQSPYGQPRNDLGYGFIGSLMAFDIAVIQDKYGVNEEFATGNNTYVLPDQNAPAQFDANGKMTKEGTSWKSIWDAGGVDQIVYGGSKDVNIDLRPATLEYEHGGGGWISYAWGVYGGYTIANKVTIENASGGSGDDTLIGNDVANILAGGDGNDKLTGGAGSDALVGNGGSDRMTGGTGHDLYSVSSSGDRVIELGNQGTDTVRSSISFNLITHVENLVLTGTADTDGRGNSGANSLTGNSGDNLLNGGAGNDRIDGGAGNDRIYGSDGRDVLIGGAGKDEFLFNTAPGSANVDDILDFSRADDQIMLARYAFTKAGPNGVLNPAAFRVGTAAADASDRIVYDQASGKIFYDSDGKGGAAAVLFATVDAGTVLTNADFVIYG
jgi:serralysin